MLDVWNYTRNALALLKAIVVYLCCALTVVCRYSYLYFEQFHVAMPEMPALSDSQLLSIEMQGYHKLIYFSGFSAITAIGWAFSRKSVGKSLRRSVDMLAGLLAAYFATDLMVRGEPNIFDHITTSLAIATWFFLITKNYVLRGNK